MRPLLGRPGVRRRARAAQPRHVAALRRRAARPRADVGRGVEGGAARRGPSPGSRSVALRRGALPFRPNAVDALALAFAAVVVLYALMPQGALGGEAGASGDRARRPAPPALRRRVLPRALPRAAARLDELVGPRRRPPRSPRSVSSRSTPSRSSWWRTLGREGLVPRAARLRLPRALRAARELRLQLRQRRGSCGGSISTFLSPLATAHMLCVACCSPRRWRQRCDGPARGRRVRGPALDVLALDLDRARRRPARARGRAAARLARRRRGARDRGLRRLRAALPRRRAAGALHAGRARRSSTQAGKGQSTEQSVGERRVDAQPLAQPARRARTVAHHPWGYGVGNSGSTATRFGAKLQAGESTYTELGVDTGSLGLALFVALQLALVRRLRFRSTWLAAALAAVLVLAVQTDVLGVPWLVFCLWLARAPNPVYLRDQYLPDSTRVGSRRTDGRRSRALARLLPRLDRPRRARAGRRRGAAGAGGRSCCTSTELPGAQPSTRETGLYHFALLVPDRPTSRAGSRTPRASACR